MSRALPARPDIDRLHREARALQRACLAGDAEAVRRLAALPEEVSPRQIALTRAQTVIAREYGFASWPRLKAHVESCRSRPAADLDAKTLAERWFVLAEAGDLRGLDRALAVGKGRKDAARAVMQREPARFAAFVQALVAGLGSPRERVRFGCAGALDQFGDATCREPLAQLMEDPVPRVRWMAMHALTCHHCGAKTGQLESHVRQRIIDAALGDSSPRVRFHATAALALARDTSAIPVLRGMLEQETDAKILRGVVWALGELARPPRRIQPG